MGKPRKQKNAIRNNNQPSNTAPNSIDYEKLANCIAKAMTEEKERIANAKSATREWMKVIIAPAFIVISVLVGILAVGFFVVSFDFIMQGFLARPVNVQDFFKGMLSLIFALIALVVALLSFWAGQEIGKEKDKHFIGTVFSGMVSLMALIVALVALIKG